MARARCVCVLRGAALLLLCCRSALRQGEVEKAKEYFQHALRCDPDFTASRQLLKAMHCGRSIALTALQKSREIASLKEQGNEAFKAGKHQEAWDIYTQVRHHPRAMP